MFTAKRTAYFFGLLVFATLMIAGSHAQTTNGTILGTVSDQTAARMPRVTVTVTNLETGISRTLVTDEAGRYRANDVEVGIYEVRAELPGFKTAVRRGIQLTVAGTAVVDLTLSVGEVTEQVVVTSEAPLVETTSSSVSALVDDKKIRDLPLNGRSYEQLAFLQPGVAPYLRGMHSSDAGEGTKFTVSGSRDDANGFLLDGTSINDQSNATPGGASGNLLGVEMLREYRVLTSNYSAEYGRYSGGIISAVTKSGTNDLHGSLYEFLRNSVLDARNFFDYPVGIRIPPFKRNQFGGTLGGPIRHDRTFFFGGYEGLRERLGVSNAAIVPDNAAHAGLLPDGAGGLSAVGVVPRVKPFLDLYPLPNGPSLGGGTARLFSNPTKPTREDYVNVRVDHKFSDSDFFFARYTLDDSQQAEPSQYPNININHKARAQYVTLDEKRIFSPRVLNDARIGFNRSYGSDQNQALFNVTPDLFFIPGQQFGLISFRGAPITPFGGNAGLPRTLAHNVWQLSDDVTITRGSHSMKAGMLFDRYDSNATLVRTWGGQYFFNTLANFLAAQPTEFDGDQPGTDNIRGWRQSLFGFYFQDDFQARSNLTFNLGFRYEFATIPTEANGKLANFRNILTDTQPTIGEPWFHGPYKDFGPRIGFSWDPWSNGKTAIRGGAGFFYDHLVAFPLNRGMSRVPPFSVNATVTGAAAVFPRVDFDRLRGDLTAQTPYSIDFTMKDPAKFSYTFSIQRQLSTQTMVSVTYVGARSYHLLAGNNGNDALPQIQPDGRKFFAAGLPRRNPNLGQVQFFVTSDGDSYYQSFQASFNRRFARGLQVQASYTLSKNINDADGFLSRAIDLDQGSVPQDPDSRRADRSLASFDIRNILSLNYTYDLPFARDLGGARGKVLSGWQINGITTLDAGTPFTAWTGFSRSRDLANGSQITDRPNLLPGFSNNPMTGTSNGCAADRPVPAGDRLGTPDRYFDVCAFGLPDPGYFGNVGRNTLIGPGLVGFDFALMKNTAFGEGKNFQFRAEFFNLLNRANFDRPSVTRTFNANGTRIGAAGIISSTLTPARQIQFGLKITF